MAAGTSARRTCGASTGRSLGIPVALLDVAKGFVPALVGLLVGGDWVGVLAGAAAMIGHARPVFLGFGEGGEDGRDGRRRRARARTARRRGVSRRLALVFALSRYASLASIVTAVALPVLAFAFGSPWPIVGFSAVAALGVILLHRHNVRRLLAGTEPRFSRTVPRTG